MRASVVSVRSVLSAFAVVASLGACEPSSSFRPAALPPLVAAAKPKPVAAAARLQLAAGESWIWDVQLQGMSIGRAELVVGDHEVHSRFATSKLASAFATVHADDVTTFDRATAQPTATRDVLDVDGDHDAKDTALAGTNRHSIHTAIGWLRAWATPDAAASTLVVEYLGKPYTLEVARPVPELVDDKHALRIDGVVRGAPKPVALTIWLSADDKHAPLRIAITTDNIHVTAQLIDS
jgi:hypothetical protein